MIPLFDISAGSMRLQTLSLPLVAACVAVGLTGCGATSDSDTEGQSDSTASGVPAAGLTQPTEQAAGAGNNAVNVRQIFDRVGRGTVTVLSQSSGPTGGGLGSGFVISDSGEIVTNAHVVTSGEGRSLRPVDEVFIRFPDTNQVEAQIVGIDPFTDVALLKVNPAGLKLTKLPLSNHGAAVGEPVVAIGSPFGEEQSVSAGVVSATERTIRSLTGFNTADALQTDAAINTGNSGGPLLNADGDVIGVNSQIESQSGDGAGVGFAISAKTVKQSVDQLRRNGKVSYSYLGISTVPVYPQLARKFKLGTESGAWIQDTPSGPAREAGLRGPSGSKVDFQVASYVQGGDVVTAIDDYPIAGPNDLAEATLMIKPGSRVTMHVVRNGQKKKVTLVTERRPIDFER